LHREIKALISWIAIIVTFRFMFGNISLISALLTFTIVCVLYYVLVVRRNTKALIGIILGGIVLFFLGILVQSIF